MYYVRLAKHVCISSDHHQRMCINSGGALLLLLDESVLGRIKIRQQMLFLTQTPYHQVPQ